MTTQGTEPTVETTPPNGIKGLAAAESWWTPEHVLVVVLPLALLLVTSWLVLVWLGRKKSKRADLIAAVDPWVALGQTIASLTIPKDEHSIDPQAWIKFSSDISLSVRQVLADASGFPCDDWTTDECAIKLQNWRGHEGLAVVDVLALLRETDLVRFADRKPAETAALWPGKVKEWYRIRDQQKHLAQSIPSSLPPKSSPDSNPTPPPSTGPLPPSSDGGLRVFD